MKKIYNLLTMLLLTFCTMGLFTGIAKGQSRYRAEDIITYSDFSNSYMVDFSPRFVFFSSENGIWRLDRFSGKSVTPINFGLGLASAVDLRNGDLLLWHDASSTLWLWSKKRGLKYFRWDLSQWYSFDAINGNVGVKNIGETEHYVVIKSSKSSDDPDGDANIFIDPHSFYLINELNVDDGFIRWAGSWEPHQFKHYWIDDSDLRYYSEDGRIRDKYNRSYEVSFDVYDEVYQRRYICYPGLGLGIANERHQSLNIIQPGPAGKDVRSIALMGSGFMWVCGKNGRNSGINLLDREKGEWQYFDSDYVTGIDSHHINDIVTHKTSSYFASEEGLVIFQAEKGRWKTVGSFSGLSGLDLRALGKSRSELFIGGDQGLNRMDLPSGKIVPAGDKRVNDLHTDDIVTDGDTVWVTGFQGAFRYQPDEWQRIGNEELVVGNEAGRCLAVTKDFFWIGGERGIRELNRKTGEWKGWLSSVYFNRSPSRSLAANDSLLWVGTRDGLHAMHLRKRRWLSYGIEEGLPSSNIQFLQVEADTLWIGTPEGLTRFIWNIPGRDIF
ncbi:MAG: hypothetical protein HN590_14225 [Calditrichaeota bacterium]|nr:hypothetical protein [Calditrichota bacterium]